MVCKVQDSVHKLCDTEEDVQEPMLGVLVRLVEVSKYKVSNHTFLSLSPPTSPRSTRQYRCGVSYHDHNKRIPSLDDVSISKNLLYRPHVHEKLPVIVFETPRYVSHTY